MPATDGIHVQGLRDLQRAFARADKATEKELKSALRAAAEPVRSTAERLAVGEIRNIGGPWSRMRVGVTRTVVYVAPRQRGARGRGGKRRPNLAPLLMDRAMAPALARNREEVVRKVENALDTVGREWERG